MTADAERLLEAFRRLQELAPPTNGHAIHEAGLTHVEGLLALRELRDAGLLDADGLT